MSTIVVNGVAREWAAGLSLADVVASLVDEAKGIAVAVDREVVPRSEWATTLLEPDARVEVVTAAAGG
jgi:sulfur carrier protein